MARPFKKLRDMLHENEITQVDLARYLGLGTATVSNRLCNREEWRLEEMYMVMDMLHLPHTMLTELFPRKGINEAGVTRGSMKRVALRRA